MESTRFRFMSSAYLASACMFVIGLVCAPMLRYWRWMVWPTLAVLLIAGLFGWRAYRLWGRWLTEVEQRAAIPQCTSCQQGPGNDCAHFTARAGLT